MYKKLLILLVTFSVSFTYSQTNLIDLLDDYKSLKQSNEKKIALDSIKKVFFSKNYKPITKIKENEIFNLLFEFYKNDIENFLDVKLLFADKNLEENADNTIKLIDSVLLIAEKKSYYKLQSKANAILGFVHNFEPKKSNEYYFKALNLINQNNINSDFKCELLLQIGDNFNRLNDSGKAIDYYIKVKECVDKETYSRTYLKACIGMGNIYNSIFDRVDAVSNFQEGLQFVLRFKKNEPLMQMRFRDGLAIAFTNHPQKGSEKIALALSNLAYLTSKTDNDDNFKITLLRQIIYLNAIFNNSSEIVKANKDLSKIASNKKYKNTYNSYVKFGELALAISDRKSKKVTKLIKEFQNEYYKDSPNLLKEQFLHLIHINNQSNKITTLNSYKKWNNFRDSIKLDFYKNYKDSLQVRYQKASTDKEITRLSSLNQLDKAEIKYKNRNLYLLLSILALMLTLLALVFYFNKKISKQKSLIESLQKELHHRIKNNLSIIDTFIEVAKEEFEDEKFTHKLTELQNRIDSINEVHLQLYKSDDITGVDITKYVETLSKNVQNSFTTNNNTVIKNKITDAIKLDPNKSFPLGLIINEFLTNSFKHAFGEKEGEVSIAIRETNSNLELLLSDNGKGLPKNFDIQKSESFGIRIMKLLSEQLDGSFDLQNDNGVNLKIQFPK